MEAIYRHYGYDFRDYHEASIRRRLWHRVHLENLQSISGLQEKVLHDRKAMERLLTDFSITVTEMFRDPPFFLAFRKYVVPLLRELPQIRIWHAGCSTGQEAFSLAILLHEEGLLKKTRLYCTDMNAQALEQAKRGSFPLRKMQLYTKNYLQAGGTSAFSEYYSVVQNMAQFAPYFLNFMVFAEHNLVTDQSFNEFHVILCRNVMIYFNGSLQNRVHDLFYESLCPDGILGLGDKEGVVFTKYASFYEEINGGSGKLYRKVKSNS